MKFETMVTLLYVIVILVLASCSTAPKCTPDNFEACQKMQRGNK